MLYRQFNPPKTKVRQFQFIIFCLVFMFLSVGFIVRAQSEIVTAPGNYQSEIGCDDTTGNGGDWEPACLLSQLTDEDGDGVFTVVVVSVPAGDYEFKIAINQSWGENYGAEGIRDGANIPLSVPVDYAQVTLSFELETKAISAVVDESIIGQAAPPPGAQPIIVLPPVETQPDMVVIPGTLQSAAGCDGDWQTDCAATTLTFDADDNLWQGSFDLPAGDYEYKVAINGTWDENYGGNGDGGGPNVPLSLSEDTTVKFYYDHQTHWAADSVGDRIVTAPGSFQSELGCPDDWQPDCLRSWLQDPDGDGLFVFTTDAIPAGDYEVKAAVNESWDENYGADGAAGGANIAFTVPADETPVAFIFNTSDNTLLVGVEFMPVVGVVASTPDLTQSEAHWVTVDTIAWDIGDIPVEGTAFKLFYSPEATLEGNETGFAGGDSIDLTYNPDGLSADVLAHFPHLEGYAAFTINEDDAAIVPGILKSQAGIAAIGADGTALDGTGLQIPGVLDDLYTYDGALGVTYDGDVPTLAVWAPTAQRVQLELFDDADPATESERVPMTLDRATGVWSVTGEADWTGKYYLYNVRVYAPSTQSIVTNRVTDPYSFSLSMNSSRSQIVNLDDTALQPSGWADMEKPPLAASEDIVLYELHVRDFSVNDMSVPEDLRGTFMAFTETESDGMKHLRALAEAGLTHIHLLPAFDIATINENAAERQEPDNDELAALPSDSEEQQAILQPLRDLDAFNWGYDPLHYTVPEGSYSTNPNGTTRIIEFREMVQALNASGLRVVMDVVYNHTNSSGQGERSVLDRIVPGYYHRLTDTGLVASSTCCANTATEHAMMEKLMVDSVVTWATQYKVDGFRFDLMGHHMRANMEKVRAALDALTVENSGVDGKSIYVYGEGWDFGEVQGGARGVNATQLNMGGTGIGTFNDRLRDAVRGGSPFGDRVFQGFISGLSLYSNELTGGTEEEQRARLLLFEDQIRIGLAGNLRDYELVNAAGDTVTGADILYNGSPAGYTLDPQEHIVYISAHDNETLWDILAYKQLPDMTMSDMVRIQNLGHSIVLLSQGVPFIHAGDDMLRSKSMDRNSYNSGDWFNRLDFTYQSNNWGVGLPNAGDNQDNWPTMQPLLADPALKPTSEDILSSVAHVQEFLRVRKSSPLFRLQMAEDIEARVTFPNTGPDQLPGLIVMAIADDGDLADLDPNAEQILVIFNAHPDEQTFADDALAGLAFELHPVLADSADAVVQTAAFDAETGTFTVPGLTAAVFVLGE
ncbi:MAG: pullulanase-type alpha-1,6-glucosidase [Anaerolineae bacterium]|nr:pullulanase-type alpha-1,6-glucosidase [Anaerolineae bacterium]